MITLSAIQKNLGENEVECTAKAEIRKAELWLYSDVLRAFKGERGGKKHLYSYGFSAEGTLISASVVPYSEDSEMNG